MIEGFTVRNAPKERFFPHYAAENLHTVTWVEPSESTLSVFDGKRCSSGKRCAMHGPRRP
jgi:hypothetical protein